MRRIIFILALVLLTGCTATVYHFEWDSAEELCKPNDGVYAIQAEPLHTAITVVCENGVSKRYIASEED